MAVSWRLRWLFEFIPETSGTDHPKTLLATEVKAGLRYRILITNYGGYRYDIGGGGSGFYGQPLIVFRYRRGGFISSTTERRVSCNSGDASPATRIWLIVRRFLYYLIREGFSSRYLANIELALVPSAIPSFLGWF